MASSIVLKPFGWYPDGHTYEALEIGAERDFGASADGLKAAKLVGDVPVKAEAPATLARPPSEPVAEVDPLPSPPEPVPAATEPVVVVEPVPAPPKRRARK